jgi:hypothetical protein
MRAVSKADYGKGGNIPSYEVLKVVTDGGEFKPDEMYFHDYDEDSEYLCWEERRADFAKCAMNGILSRTNNLPFNTHEKEVCEEIARISIALADALIAELKKTNETK